MIKEIIKKTSFGKFYQTKKRSYVRRKITKQAMKEYFFRFIDYSSSFLDEKDPRYLRLRIIVESHILEKGFSHNNYRAGFGKQVVIDLITRVELYLKCKDHDTFALENAISLLLLYHNYNLEYEFDDSSYLPVERLQKMLTDIKYVECGVKKYDIADIKKEMQCFDFLKFEKLRSSVRVYDYKCKPINSEIFTDLINIAKYAPSACNRQAVKVHFFTDESQFERVEVLQRGSKGFLKNCSAIAFITADLSLYECSEYKLPIFDAGLFTMNLCYAIESKGMFSCVLNAYFSERDNKEIKRIVGIPDYEEINGIVAIYDIEDDKEIYVPISSRREAEEIYVK